MRINNFFFISFLLLFFFLVLSCNSNQQQTPTNQADGVVPIERFNKEIATINNPQLIDVRTPKEFGAGHIDGAININYNGSNFEQSIGQLDKAQPVFIYCHSGGRSGKAYKKMKAMGFSTVYDLKGGYSGLK